MSAQSTPNLGTMPGAGPLIPDALDFLRGGWRIERRMIDYAAGDSGTFDGVARFEVARFEEAQPEPPAAAPGHEPGSAPPAFGEPAALTYHETGELRFRGHRGPASRSLIYRGRPDGTADVFFADGREFYHLDPRSGRWTGQHPCGRDHYVLAGQLLGDGTLEERWRVRGPDKDYEIFTTLVRACPARACPTRP